MTLEEWNKTKGAREEFRRLIDNPTFKHALEAMAELSPAQVSMDKSCAVGGGDFLMGRVQGWEIFKHTLKLMAADNQLPKNPKEEYKPNL